PGSAAPSPPGEQTDGLRLSTSDHEVLLPVGICLRAVPRRPAPASTQARRWCPHARMNMRGSLGPAGSSQTSRCTPDLQRTPGNPRRALISSVSPAILTPGPSPLSPPLPAREVVHLLLARGDTEGVPSLPRAEPAGRHAAGLSRAAVRPARACYGEPALGAGSASRGGSA